MSKKKEVKIDYEKKYLERTVRLPPEYSWVKTDDDEYKKALAEATDPFGPDMVVMGPGGCGKSVLLELMYKMLPGNKMVTATTGIAAYNIALKGIPAVTLHKALRLKPQAWYDTSPINYKAVSILSAIDILMIDEIAMLSANTMEYLLLLVKTANRRRQNKGYGRIRLVLFGDALQLPPVIDNSSIIQNQYETKYNNNVFFFNAPSFKNWEHDAIQLDKVYRQEDIEFANILSRIRMGHTDRYILDYINSRVCNVNEFVSNHEKDMLYLVSTNAKAEELNREYLKRFKNNNYKDYSAIFAGEATDKDFVRVPSLLRLYEGANVMCLSNGKFWQNGTIAQVVGFFGEYPILCTSNGVMFHLQEKKFEKYKYEADPQTGLITAKIIGTMQMLPCKTAFATTLYKAQGLSLNSAYFDFSGYTEASSVYLGLSRVRTIEGVGLKYPIREKDIKVKDEALSYFKDKTTLEEQPLLPGFKNFINSQIEQTKVISNTTRSSEYV